jgi:hypothetical protein
MPIEGTQMQRGGSGIVRATRDVVGRKVRNLEGEDVGEIQELMVDEAAGRITYAIMSFGGFLGMGDKLFAVPWVSLTSDGEVYRMKASKELLKNAPGFDKNNWPDMSDPDRTSEIYTYYQERPF